LGHLCIQNSSLFESNVQGSIGPRRAAASLARAGPRLRAALETAFALRAGLLVAIAVAVTSKKYRLGASGENTDQFGFNLVDVLYATQ
jgi:hypothetical protein